MTSYESESSDDDIGILKKALEVKFSADFDPNKTPQTGEEYLQYVVYERSKCRTLVTANVNRTKLQENQTFKIELDEAIAKPCSCLVPSLEWQERKLEDFKDFRKYFELKLTEEILISPIVEAEALDKIANESPKYSEVTRYTQSAKIKLLSIITNHLDKLVNSMTNTWGVWVYAILVLLEKPLYPNSHYVLREFAKKCLHIRSTLPEETVKELYMPLNLGICLVARFFDQLDLADK